METQLPTEQRKSFLQNDRLLVCGMLTIYGVCILGAIGAVFWGLNYRNQVVSANETATASILATQQAEVTATAVARAVSQDQYEYIERFDRISGDWFVGSYPKKYSDAQMTIKDGVYIWDIRDSKGFTQATDFYKGDKLKDFDIYMDIKFIKDDIKGAACAGFFFRRTDADWNNGAYTFTICDDSRFEIYYFEENRWQNITFVEYENSIQPSGWNRIEVSARDSRFTFTINNSKVFETADDRLKSGSLGIFVDTDAGIPVEIWFDNFGFQSR